MTEAKLDGSQSLRDAADRADSKRKKSTDSELRLDDEKDTLYEDGLDLDDDSSALTGINGRDDSTPQR